jgi:Sec-independent protein translocase protein TatA
VGDVVIILIIILALAVIWRGPKTIPEIGRMFGRGVRNAREEIEKTRGSDEPPPSAGSTGSQP